MPKVAAAPKKRKSSKKEEIVVLEPEPEPVIIQLPINTDAIKSLLESDPLTDPLEYCPNIMEPQPYMSSDNFIPLNDEVASTQDILENIPLKDGFNHINEEKLEKEVYKNCCYWCCHPINMKEFGIPIKYDAYYKTFTTFGNFCSLECIVAYNFATHNGSDRMWEIHSWIQMIAEQIGFETPIRPAPSRYLLKMFNGGMEIEEFRNAHKSPLKTYIMNMPPMIHIPSQMEILNTSFLNNKNNNITTTDVNTDNSKSKLSRKRAVVDMKKSLDIKMNLTIKHIEDT